MLVLVSQNTERIQIYTEKHGAEESYFTTVHVPDRLL